MSQKALLKSQGMFEILSRSDSEDGFVTSSAIKQEEDAESPDTEISMEHHLISSQPVTAERSFLFSKLPASAYVEPDAVEETRPVERSFTFSNLPISACSQPCTSGEPRSTERSFLHTRLRSDSENDSDDVESAAKRARHENISWFTKDLPSKIQDFDPNDSGNDDIALESSSVFEYFQIFLSKPLLSIIVNETNKYYKYMIENPNQGIHSRLIKWKNTTLKEMYSFLALTILMSRIKNMSFVEFWSKDSLLRTSVFGEVMSKDRYLLLLRMLHFCDNSQPRSEDRLYKIRYIVHQFQESFKCAFHPFHKFYIEESTLLYKGRLFLKQYLPSKKSKFGIKMFILCDWDSGYVLDFVIYSGSSCDVQWEGSNHGEVGDSVISLLRPYLEKGHTIFIDNWHTSPDLFLWLHHKAMNVCGTAEISRSDMPVMEEKLKREEIQFASSDILLSLKWYDKMSIWMLSTCQRSEILECQVFEQDIKPNSITDCDNSICAIEKLDLTLSSTDYVRKSIKWYKKVFFHLLDISILNARALYKVLTGKNFAIAKFQLTLIKEMLDKCREEKNKIVGEKSSFQNTPARLVERHFISMYVSERSKKKSPAKRCFVCSKHNNRRETRYWCLKCRVGLCVVPCFEIYHTKEDY